MGIGRYTGQVVVGTDGSRGSQRAIEVAARAANLRQLPLTLLLAVPPGRTPTSDLGGEALVTGLMDRGRLALEQRANELRELFPQLSLSTELMAADAAAALVGASKSAHLVVVGARGKNLPLLTQLLGGTADAVLTHAEGHVLVVPETADPHATGPVVVGVDESDSANAALVPGFESASLRGVSLKAVCAWDLPPSDLAYFDDQDLAGLQSALDAAVAAVAADFPDVPTTTQLTRGRAASVLVEASQQASLITLGSRGLGGFRGLLLGSVSREVARAAKCPVLVVRSR